MNDEVLVEPDEAVVELTEEGVVVVNLRFAPFPKGAPEGANRTKLSKMSLAMKRHIPAG